MTKTGRKPGLIRIASYNEISRGLKFRVTPRIIAYTGLLIILLITNIALFITRNDTETTILRVPGSLCQVEGNELSNIYNVQLINKSTQDISPEIRLLNRNGRLHYIGKPMQVDAQGMAEGVFLVYLPKSEMNQSKVPITFGIYSNDHLIEKETASFIGP